MICYLVCATSAIIGPLFTENQGSKSARNVAQWQHKGCECLRCLGTVSCDLQVRPKDETRLGASQMNIRYDNGKIAICTFRKQFWRALLARLTQSFCKMSTQRMWMSALSWDRVVWPAGTSQRWNSVGGKPDEYLIRCLFLILPEKLLFCFPCLQYKRKPMVKQQNENTNVEIHDQVGHQDGRCASRERSFVFSANN